MQLKTYRNVNGKLEIYRFDLQSQDVYNELLGNLASAYQMDRHQIFVHWNDSEGDFITVDSDDDLLVAIALLKPKSALLKLYITGNSECSVKDEFCDLLNQAEPEVVVSDETMSVATDPHQGAVASCLRDVADETFCMLLNKTEELTETEERTDDQTTRTTELDEEEEEDGFLIVNHSDLVDFVLEN